MKTIYPGTFDPMTLGHVDIIYRASKVFGKITVAIAHHNNKESIFTAQERTDMANVVIQEYMLNAKAVMFEGLLVDFMAKNGVGIIIRGLRVSSDFEYEFQMSCMNSRLDSSIETVFLPAKDDMHFISSRMIKSVASLGGNISQFVPQSIVPIIQEYYKSHKNE